MKEKTEKFKNKVLIISIQQTKSIGKSMKEKNVIYLLKNIYFISISIINSLFYSLAQNVLLNFVGHASTPISVLNCTNTISYVMTVPAIWKEQKRD